MLSRKIVKLDDKKIVTDGLMAYLHYTKGFNGDSWENLSPHTSGINATYLGSPSATLTNNGVYVPMGGAFKFPPLMFQSYAITVDYSFIIEDGGVIFEIGTPAEFNVRVLGYVGNQFWRFGYGSITYSNIPLPYGTLINATIVIDSYDTHMSIYQDGVYRGIHDVSVAPRLIDCNYQELFIGAFPNGTTSFKGTMRMFRIYNRKLTVDEIYQNSSVGLDLGL